MHARNSLVAGLFLLLGLLGMLTSIGYGVGAVDNPSPGMYPAVLSALLAVLALWLLVSSLRTKTGTEVDSLGGIIPDRSAMARFTGVILAIFAFAILLEWLGFIFTSFIFTATLFLIGTPTRPALAMLLTTLTVAFAYVLFVVVLRVPFPHGVWG